MHHLIVLECTLATYLRSKAYVKLGNISEKQSICQTWLDM